MLGAEGSPGTKKAVLTDMMDDLRNVALDMYVNARLRYRKSLIPNSAWVNAPLDGDSAVPTQTSKRWKATTTRFGRLFPGPSF